MNIGNSEKEKPGEDGELVYDDINWYLLGIFSAEWKWGDEFLGLNKEWDTYTLK